MNADTLAQDKLADNEYIRTLIERRNEHLRCAALLGNAITALRDMREEYERDGSYVVESTPDKVSRFVLGEHGELPEREAA